MPPAPALLAQAWQKLESEPAAVRQEADAMLASAPGDADATLLRAASLRRLGDSAGACAALRPLMSNRVKSPVAWFEWGMALCASSDDDLALAALQQTVRLAPDFVAAWRALGDLHIALGGAEPAGQAYAQAAQAMLATTPLAPSARLVATGRAAEAEAQLKAHVRENPEDARGVWLLAEAAMRTGRTVEAERLLAHLLTARPHFAEARHSLAILLYLQRRFAEAVPALRALLAALPHQPSLSILLATSLVEIGDHAAALPLYEAMLAAFPDRAIIRLRYGQALKTLGREGEAAQAYRHCLDAAPPFSAGVWLSLADLKTAAFTTADIAAMRNLPSRPDQTDFQRAQAHYALGRALEQKGEYETAFGHFAQGAALRRLGISYRADDATAFVEKTKSVFTPAIFAARHGSGDPSAAPIFIVGMPRAGSTLVEQILASHPEVEGTQELTVLPDIVTRLQELHPGHDLPRLVEGLDKPALARLGALYLDGARQFRRLGRTHFTDKLPDNFRHIGLIQLILPNAKIVDIRRAPMAAGFAAFQQFFQAQQTGQDYSYDLAEIGRYTQDYTSLMAHFDEMLPGRVLHIQYETLVTDTETQIRRLLDHCGLAFDPACLRFWETERPVHTPSAQQVRQPIFTSGLEHWRHYDPWLGPLREALGPLA